MPQALRCAEHPDVETYLRCGECDTPICPRCLVQTPVGAKCKVHARLRKHPLHNASPLQLAKGGTAALGTGFGLGVLWSFLSGVVPFLGILGFFIYLGLGYVVGEATSQASNRKRGTALQAFAVAGTLVAFAAPFLLFHSLRGLVNAFIPSNLNQVLFLFMLFAACYIAALRVR